ncbi:hypothetical protein ACFL6N_04490 [Thermodesulfobacteriota bacterium]
MKKVINQAVMLCLSASLLISCGGGSGGDSSPATAGSVSMSMDGVPITISGGALPEIYGMFAQLIHNDMQPGSTKIHRRFNATVGFDMIFPGEVPGIYNASGFGFQWAGIQYWNCTNPMVTVTRFDDVKGRIAGSFSTLTCDANPNTTPNGTTWPVTITDGTFDVYRVENDIY